MSFRRLARLLISGCYPWRKLCRVLPDNHPEAAVALIEYLGKLDEHHQKSSRTGHH